tara:strand:- start:110 stop:832 length:723 start_codon:yes stop_codon:yes gene_type:complete
MDKVIDYSVFKQVHAPEGGDEETARENRDSEDDSETESETDSDSASDSEVDDGGDLKGFVVPDDIEDTEDEAEENNDADDDDDDDEANADSNESKSKNVKDKSKGKSKSKSKDKNKRKDKSKGKKPEKKVHVSIAMLKKEATRTVDGRRRYMKYLRKNWQPSAKVTKCMQLLETFLDVEDPRERKKTIIFSQFVSLLDLLQVPIDQKKWKCLRYDGTMSADLRNDAINKFTDSKERKSIF